MTSIKFILEEFVSNYLAKYEDLYEVFDPKWRSPCEIADPFVRDDGIEMVKWRPVARRYAEDFAGLENALETEIHPDIKDYFGTFWSGGLEAEAPQGHVSLIFLWNQLDSKRLTENLIGHALAKRREKSPFSVFFACTDVTSELFLSIENDTGHVLLEKPGYKPVRSVADSLSDFLSGLTPTSPFMHPERRELSH